MATTTNPPPSLPVALVLGRSHHHPHSAGVREGHARVRATASWLVPGLLAPVATAMGVAATYGARESQDL